MFSLHFSRLARLVSAPPPQPVLSCPPTCRISQRVRPHANLAAHRAALTSDPDAYLAGIPRVRSPTYTPQFSNFLSDPSPAPPASQYQEPPPPSPKNVEPSVTDQNIASQPPSRANSQLLNEVDSERPSLVNPERPNEANPEPPNHQPKMQTADCQDQKKYIIQLFNTLNNNRAALNASAESLRDFLFSPQNNFSVGATEFLQLSFESCAADRTMTSIVRMPAYVLAQVFKDRKHLDAVLPLIYSLRPALRPGFIPSSATLKERGYSEPVDIDDPRRIGMIFAWYFDFLCYQPDRIREFVIPKITHLLRTPPVFEMGPIVQFFLDICGQRVAAAFPDDMKRIVGDLVKYMEHWTEAEGGGPGVLRDWKSWTFRINRKIQEYHEKGPNSFPESQVPSD
jgi:hypothetical protein